MSHKYQIKIKAKQNLLFFVIGSIFTLMVSLSIFMIHQHYFLDFPAAVIVCELVYFVIVKFTKKPNPMERMFTSLNVGLLLESSQNVTKHCKKIN